LTSRVSSAGVLTIASALMALALCAVAALPSPARAAPVPATAARDTAPVARMSVPRALPAATRGEVVLVDVRAPGQRALGHIRGDIHVPLEQLPARTAELPKDRTLVFYCSCPAEELALDAARAMIAAGGARVAALVGGFDAWRAGGGPVVVDAPWEVVFRVDDPPGGWGKTPVDSARCRYARDDSVAFQGSASGRITCLPGPAPPGRGFAGFTQRVPAGALPGRRVTLSAELKSEGVERPAFLWIAAEDADGRMIPLAPPDAAAAAGTTDWRFVQVSGVVPPVARRLLVGLSLPAAGRVWLDDVRLVAEEESGMPRIRMVIENHGFEE
jgi:rhodanese-related sulfurtransferase